jgi:hypothetical protein
MKTSITTLDQLIESLGGCLNEESARRLVSLKPSRKLQVLMDRLSRKSSAGTLSDQEREEYRQYVTFGTFVAMLKSKARVLLTDARVS